jgi:hypothetical protein
MEKSFDKFLVTPVSNKRGLHALIAIESDVTEKIKEL